MSDKPSPFNAGNNIDALEECGCYVRVACLDGEPVGISEGLVVKPAMRAKHRAVKADYEAAGGRAIDTQIVAELHAARTVG